MRKLNRLLSLLLVAVIVSAQLHVSPVYADEAKSIADFEAILDAYKTDTLDYESYYERYKSYIGTGAAYVIEAGDFTRTEGMDVRYYQDYEGMDGESVLTDEQGMIEWTVNIDQPGMYNIAIEYYPFAGKSSDIQRSLFVNGGLPFSESRNLEFYRVWTNNQESVTVDAQGNDVKPKQIEAPEWCLLALRDYQGYYTEPFKYFLDAGVNTLTLYSSREPMLIRRIYIYEEDPRQPYSAYIADMQAQFGFTAAQKTGNIITIEGEVAERKSSPMLYPRNDNSNLAAQPNSARVLKNNTIGGSSWNTSGQWIEWDFTVDKAGYYKIGMNNKQNFARDAAVYRQISIDGVVPFEEMNYYDFDYSRNWRMDVLGGNDDPYLFYLTEGPHTLRMEVVLGDMTDYIRRMEDTVIRLNDLYRQVIMIIGTEPDINRDYQIGRRMPELEATLASESQMLFEIYDALTAMTGTLGGRYSTLRTMALELENLSKDVELFTRQLSNYKTCVGSLGTWIMDARSMPLQIDALFVIPAEENVPSRKVSWIRGFWHQICLLVYSFFIDYNAIGNIDDGGTETKTTITVWVGTGRDQATTIKALTDETFKKETGIGVNLMIVDMASLLPATLSGQGPDVAMMVGGDLAMNYGIRGAVVDLTEFDDFETITQRFDPSSLVGFTFRDRTFALPETQTFYMMYYRKDILHELGLNLPTTWEEVRHSLTVLNKNNMTFGLPATTAISADTYIMFLYQLNGELYRDNGRRSNLDSDVAVAAFKEYCRFYSDYGLERVFDFANRFRTGEMPIGIADFTVYNTLQVFAPEIKGLWGFTSVPGTVQADGSINNTVTSAGSCVVIMNTSDQKDEAWEFLKWWTSASVQSRYGREMEGLMGAAARYPTANLEALSDLPWPVADYQKLVEQRQNLRGTPQVPGGYFTARHINNAFLKVVVAAEIGARESLMDYVPIINEEIEYKFNEFRLD